MSETVAEQAVAGPLSRSGPVHPFLFSGGVARRVGLGPIGVVVERALEKLFHLRFLDQRYQQLPRGLATDDFLQASLDTFDIGISVDAEALANIPATGPVVVVANHPFGALEGVVLAQLLRRIRPDVRIMANHLLQRIPEISNCFIGVDVLSDDARQNNVAAMREAQRWLKDGGLLAMFPAGEVSHLDWQHRSVTDPKWSGHVARLVKSAEADVVPLYFHGRNSTLFQLAGVLHPRLRTALIPRESIRKAGSSVRVSIGQKIGAKDLRGFGKQALVDYLRFRTYLLGRDTPSRPDAAPRPDTGSQARIVAPEPVATLRAEVARLPASAVLASGESLTTYLATADMIPHILREIGRLREVTFRETGEGTGDAIDLDDYDAYYHHLFIWDSTEHAVVGAYRLGIADRILAERGKKGLYTYSLFRYRSKFIRRLGPSIELGRSFIRQEYQRGFAPLLMLWKGIATVVARNPDYTMLFGPVSISDSYDPISQQLMVLALSNQPLDEALDNKVKPRKSFKPTAHKLIKGIAAELLDDIDDVSRIIAAIESAPKGIPILLRQYLRMGAKVLAFNVDDQFSDVLDAFIVVDLRKSDRASLRKYMGANEAQGFLDYHGINADS